MKLVKSLLLACTALSAAPAVAEDAAEDADSRPEILVTAGYETSGAATKTDVPAIEVPQPVFNASYEFENASEPGLEVYVDDTLRRLGLPGR